MYTKITVNHGSVSNRVSNRQSRAELRTWRRKQQSSQKESILDLLGVEPWAITLPNLDLVLKHLLKADISIVASQLKAKNKNEWWRMHF